MKREAGKKKLQFKDFSENDAWLIFRLDTQIQNQPVDAYMVMDLPNGLLLASNLESADVMSQQGAISLLQEAREKKGSWPERVLLGKGDPAQDILTEALNEKEVALEEVPTTYLEDLIAPAKEAFGKFTFSPSSMAYSALSNDVSDDERESAKHYVPDSYDPCPCGSDKKFKFCCKPIFRETQEAMMAAQSGNKSEALNWISKAKEIVGETAEILCREAIVHSFFDHKKMEAVLKRCLQVDPNHPRANYISGIEFVEKGNFNAAVKAYENAIQHYPKTDKYHLNETYNNLGSAYFELKNFKAAKTAWEQALVLLPSDHVVKRNLIEFIYANASVPVELRTPSPFVERFLNF